MCCFVGVCSALLWFIFVVWTVCVDVVVDVGVDGYADVHDDVDADVDFVAHVDGVALMLAITCIGKRRLYVDVNTDGCSIRSCAWSLSATFVRGQAAHRGMLSICELVVEKGVDVAAMSDDGITALIAAASEGHAAIVDLLLGKAGADANAKDKVITED